MNAVVDRVVQYPHRYQLKNVNTGEVLGTFDLEPITGTISVVGTKIDKELFDSIASDLSARLVANGGDAKDNVITYTMANNRSNIVSGEKLSVSFGKIAKYFNDLKAVAFSGDKRDIDLGNVDNTSDKDKPISTATKTALDKKANTSDLTSHTSNTSNPHSVTKSQVGLGNVDNTSDADKPVSNATQQALNNKANSSDVYTKTETDGLLNDKANANNVYTKTETDNGINKSLYNLGYYDTITANSDGTYTITRQTGYIVLDGVKNKFDSKGGSTKNNLYYYSNIAQYVEKPSSTAIVGNIICNRFITRTFDYIYNNNVYGITLYTDGRLGVGLTTAITNVDEANAYLVQNPISIQYKLATSYTEKVEANHYARYNERFILDHNKSEAERSCNLFNNPYNYSGTNNGVSINVVGNECVLNGTSTNGFYQTLGSVTLKAGTYTYNQIILSGSVNGNISLVKFGLYQSGDLFPLGELTGTYTLTQDTTISIVVWFGTAGITFNNCKLAYMLNEGSVALPYQPYEGKVVHEKELDNYRKNIYTTSLDANAIYNSSNYYGYDITNAPSSYGNLLTFQYSNKNDIPNFAIQLFLDQSSNTGDPSIYIRGSTSDAYRTWKRLAFVDDIPTFKTINGNSIVGSGDLSITPGIFTKLGNKTNFSFDSGSYLVVANNGLVTITGTDPLNVGSSANKKYLGIFMVTIAEYDGGQSLRVNTEQVFFADYVSGTISGPTFTIYKLN